MKKISKLVAFVMVVLAALIPATTSADNIRAGAAVVVPGGGDVNSGEVGFGAQIVFPVSESWSLELSGSKFDDSLDITSMSLTQFALSLRKEINLNERWMVFIGGGINYNQMTADVDDPSITVQMEDVVGYHAGLGLEVELCENLSLFVEGRYSIIETTAVVGSECRSEVVDGSYDHGLLRAGLNFRF